MIFDPVAFVVSLYSAIGAMLAAIWFHLSKPQRLRWSERALGLWLYFFVWPVMVALDVAEAYKVSRKMRAAYRKKGYL